MNRTKVSKESPDWFHVITDKKVNDFNDYLIKNEDTLSIFSRYQKWITVTPRTKNRKRPLEGLKKEKMEETSKVMPKWMQIRGTRDHPTEEFMRSQEYKSLRDVIRIYIIYLG